MRAANQGTIADEAAAVMTTSLLCLCRHSGRRIDESDRRQERKCEAAFGSRQMESNTQLKATQARVDKARVLIDGSGGGIVQDSLPVCAAAAV